MVGCNHLFRQHRAGQRKARLACRSYWTSHRGRSERQSRLAEFILIHQELHNQYHCRSDRRPWVFKMKGIIWLVKLLFKPTGEVTGNFSAQDGWIGQQGTFFTSMKQHKVDYNKPVLNWAVKVQEVHFQGWWAIEGTQGKFITTNHMTMVWYFSYNQPFSWPWSSRVLLSKFPGFHTHAHWVVGISQWHQHRLFLEPSWNANHLARMCYNVILGFC
jgi:hypothetical protein